MLKERERALDQEAARTRDIEASRVSNTERLTSLEKMVGRGCKTVQWNIMTRNGILKSFSFKCSYYSEGPLFLVIWKFKEQFLIVTWGESATQLM